MLTLEDRIKDMCGVIDPEKQLDLTADRFEETIEIYLDSTKEWLQVYLKRSYSIYPQGLEEIIVEIVSNIIRNQGFRKGLFINTEDDESKNYIERVITDDIKTRLSPYKKRKIKVLRF